MMTKYYHIFITTALGDCEDFYTQINGWSELEVKSTLEDYIDTCISAVNDNYFDADEIAARHIREIDYYEGAEVYAEEISHAEYAKNMNY